MGVAGFEGTFLSLQILSCASHVAHTSSCLAVLVSATSLLSACHRLTLPAAEAPDCLAPVTLLCRLLLSSTHWLVRHKALEAFKDFAQVLTLLLSTPLRTPRCSARPAV